MYLRPGAKTVSSNTFRFKEKEVMSNEIKCHVLMWGPSKDVEAFTTNFEREQFNAHVPIPVDAQPKAECDEIYLSRQLGIEHWGTRFIYRSEERRVGKECRSRWSPYH